MFRLLIPLLIAAIVQSMLFAALFLLSGISSTTEQNEVKMMTDELSFKQEYIKAEMNRWSSLEDILKQIDKSTAQTLNKFNSSSLLSLESEYRYDASDYPLSELLLLDQCEVLLSYLLRSSVNGVFIVLKSDDYSGLYLRSDNNKKVKEEDVSIRVAPSLARTYLEVEENVLSSSTDTVFNIDPVSESSLFYFLPLLNALNAGDEVEPRELGYWSRPFLLGGKGGSVLTYTVPLIHNSVVYGVFGIEITLTHFKKMLPSLSSNADDSSSYLIGITSDGGSSFRSLFETGEYFRLIFGASDSFDVKCETEYADVYELSTDGEAVLASVGYLDLYIEGSPYMAEAWAVISIISRAELFTFAQKLRTLFIILIVIVLFLGMGAALITSALISAPIQRLTRKIKCTKIQDRLTLDRCNIYELDQMVDEIIKLSDRLVEVERAEKAVIEFERDYDVLTNLLSRRAFMRRLSELETNPKQLRQAAMIVLDLDGLKEINDSFGHQMGDKYIRAGAATLKKFLSERALIGRLGGDEFTVFFYGYDNKSELREVINRLKEELKRDIVRFEDVELEVRFSAGVSWYPDDSTSMETLIRCADIAMYSIKRSGKNSLQEYKDLPQK